jgi:hypothetical protein
MRGGARGDQEAAALNLTRRLTVFTSAVEFVDLKVSNYKLSCWQGNMHAKSGGRRRHIRAGLDGVPDL